MIHCHAQNPLGNYVVLELLAIMPADPAKDTPPHNYAHLLPKVEAPGAVAVGSAAIFFVIATFSAVLIADIPSWVYSCLRLHRILIRSKSKKISPERDC